MDPRSAFETAKLVAQIREENPTYIDVRVLSDGTVAALHDLLYTRSIMLDCNKRFWGNRFCFKDRNLATQRFYELQSCDDEPQGYIARR